VAYACHPEPRRRIPNDEARMTNVERMTKPEARKMARSIQVLSFDYPFDIRHLSFGHSFVLRHSCFVIWIPDHRYGDDEISFISK
jgi:hypothetical protein